MAQIINGTVSVTNGSAIVTGTDTTWVTDGVSISDGFTIYDSGVSYDVASIDSETQITLSANYAGTTASGLSYIIYTDFTSPDSIPELNKGDIETATIWTRAVRKIQDLFTQIKTGTYELTGVNITGGSITGITDLAVADGGTGASTAVGAQQNLGVEVGVDVAPYLKHNYSGTVAPTVNDDDTQGYSAGSIWFDTTASPKEAYRCLDATTGAAVWLNTTLELGELGTIATQDANNVNITGGNIVIDTFTALSSSDKSFKNYIRNGGMTVAQRGDGPFTNSGYTIDGIFVGGSGTTFSSTRQLFTPGQTIVPGNPKYYLRHEVTSVAGAGNSNTIQFKIRGSQVLSNKTGTFSIYMQADVATNVAFEATQDFGTTGTPASPVYEISVTTIPIGTSWTRVDFSPSFPDVAGKTLGDDDNDYIRINIWFDAGSDFNARTNSLGQQSGIFYLALPQLEEGDFATDFEFLPDEIQRGWNLAYYIDSGSITAGKRQYNWSGAALNIAVFADFPVAMRAIPTVTAYGDIADGSPFISWDAGPLVTEFGFTAYKNVPNTSYLDLQRYVASAEL